MNQKIAKRLRKFAKELAIQVMAGGKEVVDKGYVEIVKNRKKQIIYKKDAEGNPVLKEGSSTEFEIEQVIDIASGTILNSKTSLRGIYRNLKKNMKQGIKVLPATA